MKKSFLRLLLVLAGFAGVAASAKAQDPDQMLVKIPFSFVAAGQTLPAGEYKISRLLYEEPRILLLVNLENRSSLVMLRPESQEAPHGRVQLEFATAGDQHFLSRIETAGQTYNLSVPQSEALLAATPRKSGAASSSTSGSN